MCVWCAVGGKRGSRPFYEPSRLTQAWGDFCDHQQTTWQDAVELQISEYFVHLAQEQFWIHPAQLTLGINCVIRALKGISTTRKGLIIGRLSCMGGKCDSGSKSATQHGNVLWCSVSLGVCILGLLQSDSLFPRTIKREEGLITNIKAAWWIYKCLLQQLKVFFNGDGICLQLLSALATSLFQPWTGSRRTLVDWVP